MFRKRQKKVFPPGTFIPMPARVCAIIQLCLAFTIILWNMSQPFAGELFTLKSKLVLFEDVMGIGSKQGLSNEKVARLDRNAARFKELPLEDSASIVKGMQQVQGLLQRSFMDKMVGAGRILVYEIPLYEQLWLILSLIIPILLLKRVEGASQAVWLLPLLAALYAFDNRWNGQRPEPSQESLLFPTEEVLIASFMHEPLSANIFEQQEQLKQAWQSYLIKVWGNEEKSEDPVAALLQSEKGEFAFNIARANVISEQAIRKGAYPQEPLLLLGIYLSWNTLFAVFAFKSLYVANPD